MGRAEKPTTLVVDLVLNSVRNNKDPLLGEETVSKYHLSSEDLLFEVPFV